MPAERSKWPDRRRLADGSREDAKPRRGRVTLLGAGPGDPELLTLKALRVLERADLVLFDDLVSPEILDLTRRTARRLHVGKRGGRPSCRQDYIHRLMIRYARRGLEVVRLKSGDPLVFGRAGEELSALRRAGIDVAIVPGITSALALGAVMGCSLTERGFAQSVEFITAQDRDGALCAALARADGEAGSRTLVIYMGGARAADIVACLRAAGHPAATPAVAVAGLTRPDQAMWHGALAGLVEGVCGLPVGSPVIIGIGRVFRDAGVAAGIESARAGGVPLNWGVG